nr:hypothetical protein [uncultured Allomuricauda sp.]
MEFTNPFTPILQEIRELKKEVVELRNRIPVEKSIRRYSIQELEENTPLSGQTIRAAIKDGRIHAEQFGRKYLITAEEFDRVCVEAKSIKYQRQ